MSATIQKLLSEVSCDRYDAELLLAHILDKDRSFVIAYNDHVLTQQQCIDFRELSRRRAEGEPLAYLTGTKEFYGRAFTVTPATLIPRPETEILVERALAIANAHITAQKKQPLIIVDVGTGSGAIITTLATELAAAHSNHSIGFIATDTSIDALHVADANARALAVSDQIAFIHADLLSPFLTSTPLTRMLCLGAHLLICANLPYVDSAQRDALLTQLESRALAFEPADALWADDGGLALYKRLIAQLTDIHAQAPHASITALCEIDPAQKEAITTYLHDTLPSVATTSIHNDLTKRARIVEFSLHTITAPSSQK